MDQRGGVRHVRLLHDWTRGAGSTGSQDWTRGAGPTRSHLPIRIVIQQLVALRLWRSHAWFPPSLEHSEGWGYEMLAGVRFRLSVRITVRNLSVFQGQVYVWVRYDVVEEQVTDNDAVW